MPDDKDPTETSDPSDSDVAADLETSEQETAATLEVPGLTPDFLQPTMFEHSLPGYLELREDYRETARAVTIDYNIEMAASTPRQFIELKAQPEIDRINELRAQKNLEHAQAGHPEDKIPLLDAKKLELNFLIDLTEPTWSDHFPKDNSPEEIEKWEEFKAGFGEAIQTNLEEMRIMDYKIDQLSKDEKLQTEFNKYTEEEREVTMIAAQWRVADKRIARIEEQIASVYISIGNLGRDYLTPAEEKKINRLKEEIARIKKEKKELVVEERLQKPVDETLQFIQAIENKAQLDKGLLLNGQMKKIIKDCLPSISRGEPMLLMGETGTAKTALAFHICRNVLHVEPELMAGYGDANSYQLMGKNVLLPDGKGGTETVFVPGPMVRAIENGVPIILDEMNTMSIDLIKRLNFMVQLRPGDTFKLQEDSGKVITVKPGFCVIGTGNPKSKRYKGVEELSADFANRFVGNTYQVEYPDNGRKYSEAATDNFNLALAAIIDADGYPPDYIDGEDFRRFVSVARVSQQLFNGNHGEGFTTFEDTSRAVDNKPGLEDFVIAPRTMVKILKKIKRSFGQITIRSYVKEMVSEIQNPNDRKVMISVLKGHGLIEDTQEDQKDNVA